MGEQVKDFYQLRDSLVQQNSRFSSENLGLVPYTQLHLCCIGNAGVAMCSLSEVRAEKAKRRAAYQSFSRIDEDENFLRFEGMYDDVKRLSILQNAPIWTDLTNRQQAWAKLICVYNHLDNTHPRMNELILLLRQTSVSTLPPEPASKWIRKLRGLMTVYPGRMSGISFREAIGAIAESLLDFFPDEERKVCEQGVIQDFSCTSDCFRVVGF